MKRVDNRYSYYIWGLIPISHSPRRSAKPLCVQFHPHAGVFPTFRPASVWEIFKYQLL